MSQNGQVLTGHSNIMAGKSFTLFDECAARCVPLKTEVITENADWNKQNWCCSQSMGFGGTSNDI